MMDEITRRQQDRELLFNELDHRVKNTLATVQAIAISTFNTPERGKAAVPEFSARIVALGKAHDVLTREKWEGAHLREIAVRVMEPVTGRAGVRCMIEGPDVFLEPRQALAFTMVLHELCTNAVKYGALSQPSGTVRVSWELGPQAARPSLTLTWKEHDGPPVMTPERTGFGSRLIRQGFARELGEVALDFEPDGVRCVIRTQVEPSERRLRTRGRQTLKQPPRKQSRARASSRQVDTGWRKKMMLNQEPRAGDLMKSGRIPL